MSGIIGISPDMKSGVIGAFDPEVDTWINSANDTSPGDITTNLVRYSSAGSTFLGKGMTVSSGVFTFPSTGTWKVMYTMGFYSMDEQNYIQAILQTQVNGGSFADAVYSYMVMADGSGNINGHTRSGMYFGVKNTANYKVKFKWLHHTGTVTLRGASTPDTLFQFEKISPKC